MLLTIDPQRTFWEVLFCVKKECVVDDFLINVALHEDASLLLLLWIDQLVNDLHSGWVVLAPL